MNKQFDKLVEQAEEWVCKNYPDAMDDNDEFHAQTMHKLGELLVRKCAKLIDAEESQSSYGDMLKQHFGVEE